MNLRYVDIVGLAGLGLVALLLLANYAGRVVETLASPFLIAVDHQQVVITTLMRRKYRTLTEGWHLRLPLEQPVRYAWRWVGESAGKVGEFAQAGWQFSLRPIRIDPAPLRVTTADDNTVELNMWLEFTLRSPEDAWKLAYPASNCNAMEYLLDVVNNRTIDAARRFSVADLTRTTDVGLDLADVEDALGIRVTKVQIQGCAQSGAIQKQRERAALQQHERHAEAARIEALHESELRRIANEQAEAARREEAAVAARLRKERADLELAQAAYEREHARVLAEGRRLQAEAEAKAAAARVEAEARAAARRLEAEAEAECTRLAAAAEAEALRARFGGAIPDGWFEKELEATTRRDVARSMGEGIGKGVHFVPADARMLLGDPLQFTTAAQLYRQQREE